MKDQQISESQEIGLENSQSLTYVWKKLKSSIFDVLFVLLDNSDDEESMLGLCLETGVDYLQMMSFPFDDVVINVWNADKTLDNITGIFNKINVSTYIPGVGFDTFLILMYSLITLIILVILDIVYVAYSFSKKKFSFTWPLVFLAKIVPLIVTVMFLPIMETLLEVVNCQNAPGQNYQVMVTFPMVRCWEGWHLFHSGITLLFSFFFVFISCIVTLALFEPRMTTNRLTARQNSTGEVVFIINKIICQFIFSFSPFKGSLPYSIMLFVLSGWLYSTYNLTQPYYSKKAGKFFRIVSTYYFWTNLMLMVSEILRPLGFKDGLVIWTCGIIFIGITIIFERKSNIETLFSSSLKFKSGEELESHLQYVLHLHHSRNSDKNSYMLLLGYIEKHIEVCLEEDCPLRITKTRFMTGKEEEELSCKQLLKQLERMFVYGIKKYPQCTKLHLTFAFFYMEKMNSKSKAYQQFTKALLETDPSFGQQFIIYRFRKIITEKLQENQDDQRADLIELIRFDNHISLCEEGMNISGKLHKQFWLELLEESPNLNRLNLIGARITQTSNVIRQNYKQLLKLCSGNLSLAQLQYNYALYLIFIIQDIGQGKKIMEQVKAKYREKRKNSKLKQNQTSVIEMFIATVNKSKKESESSFDTQKQLENVEKGILIIDIQSDIRGYQDCRIKQANQRFLELTRFSEKQICDKKLDKILPSVLEKFHTQRVVEWLEGQKKANANKGKSAQSEEEIQNQSRINTKPQYLDSIRIGHIRDSGGYLIKVNYKVKFVFISNKFVVEVEMFSSHHRENIILCDTEGIIKQTTLCTPFDIPDVNVSLDVDTLLQKNVIGQLKTKKSNYCFSAQTRKLNSKDKAQFSGIAERVQMSFMTPSRDEGEGAYEQVDVDGNPEYRKSLGIIVTLHEIIRLRSEMGKETSNRKNKRRFAMPSRIQSQKNGGIDSHSVEDLTKNNLVSIKKQIQNFYSCSDSRKRRQSVLLSNQSASSDRVFQFVDYSKYRDEEGRICQVKAYRYHANKFKRIYYDDLLEDESDYDFEEKMIDIESRLSKQKIKDQNYQARLKKAINTFVYHPEIKGLGCLGVGLLIMILVCHLVVFFQFQEKGIKFSLEQINVGKKNSDNTIEIVNGLLEAMFDYQIDPTLESHVIKFEVLDGAPWQVVPSFLREDRQKIQLTFQMALVRIQANLVKFYDEAAKISDNSSVELEQCLESQLMLTYENFIVNFMNILEQNFVINYTHKGLNSSLAPLAILAATAIVLFSLVFLIGWIYWLICIKAKIECILIWFLDIPNDYLTYAYKQCLYFNKNYMESRKIIDKNIKIDECEHYISEYQPKTKTNKQNEVDIEDPNAKIRQLLISRYMKQTFIKKLKFSQLHKCWTFLIINAFIFVVLYFQQEIASETSFVISGISIFSREMIWVCSLPMVARIDYLKNAEITSSDPWPYFTNDQLRQKWDEISAKVRGESQSSEEEFKMDLFNSLVNRGDIIAEKTLAFTYENLCQNSQSANCSDMIDGRLMGGFNVFRQLIETLPIDVSQQQLYEIYTALRRSINESLRDLLGAWTQFAIERTEDIAQAIQIGVYLYLIVGVLFFMISWTLYLRVLNLNLNQTIQILNLIPIYLVPVHRKEVRQFLKWIIYVSSRRESTQ